MTILTVFQEACTFLGMDIPDGVMSSSTREHIELKRILQDCADMIAKSHKWQLLSTLATITGDGSTEDWDLEDDFDWMPDGNELWSSSTNQPLSRTVSENDWLGSLVMDFEPNPPAWIIYGGQIHIRQALASAVTAKYFYQSNLINDPASGANSATFTLDTDTFRLNERLLKLAVVYRWKQAKGQPYAEEMNDYANLLERLISRDKGGRILKQGRPTVPRDVRIAYTGNVPTS